ncbi:MAG: type II toxin-antitoxin system VapC family toxin [Hyphomonadaceae bacterium]
MRLLLDTHTLIWWLENRALSSTAKKAICNPGNEVWVSVASACEISFKVMLGKLPSCASLIPKFSETLFNEGFRHLECTIRHGIEAGRLPLMHRDPWDRMLAAQAIVEDMPIVSNDEKLSTLGARRVW